MPEDEPTFLYELARNSEELALLEYLTQSEKPLIRYRAAEILGSLASSQNDEARERVVEALVRTARRDENDSVRAAAIDAIYLRDEDSLDRLIGELTAAGIDDAPDWTGIDRPTEWLEADHAEFRLLASAAVGRIGDERALSALHDVCTDPDVRVRTRAVRSCGAIGSSRSVEVLADRLEDRNDQVRRAAAAALAKIGTEAALEALLPAARSDSESVRVIAVGELGRFGSMEPVPVLVDSLEDGSELVRRTATRSLLELFANAPSDRSHEIREAVSAELTETDTAPLVTQLITILSGNPPQYVRRNGTWLLGRVADAETRDDVQECLLRTLEDPDEITAKFAMSALAQFGEPSLEARLRRLIRNESSSSPTKRRAEFVLERIKATPSREVVTNSVEFTYVSDPADYTEKKREEASNSGDG
ncbi:HEAT repeat domain-containing protein [Natrarchaeobius chitinivorans]|uniref:HEAT repeat domain-containing protein n=1 Tax=Natrarchaeobius chitinivorans TaxID=1679083 RepID=A0A3N6NEL3_NATCH|nr:HEAT repeat domain-containing protein [Natrarchaeobius chitinivorans]RQG97322.1 HEAT repeat domain-containing protein [Natrarchaeobius chitinivorans]